MSENKIFCQKEKCTHNKNNKCTANSVTITTIGQEKPVCNTYKNQSGNKEFSLELIKAIARTDTIQHNVRGYNQDEWRLYTNSKKKKEAE